MRRIVCLWIAGGVAMWAHGDLSYWVSARGAAQHQISQYDANGKPTGIVLDQVGGAQASAWGYRDGMADRDGHIYFGWDGGVARHNADGSDGTQIIFGSAPGGVGTWRGLAYDPTGDEGRGSIWAQSWGSGLAETTLSGGLLRSFPNNGTTVYGLAYDDFDGNLWVHGVLDEIVKVDTRTGLIIPGEGWPTGGGVLAAGGLSGLHDGTRRVAAIVQGSPGGLIVYNVDGTISGGPWDTVEGSLGVAVAGDERCGTFLCGDANCDGGFNGGDIDEFFLALGDPAAWQAAHPSCDMLCVADINFDNAVNGGDIDPFFEALGVGSCRPPP
ncbi:MAG: hypothetical protein IH986_03050 [Planctomycetes bacterium]|nr:hypothetical protein [Planctomycetota bacterium]